jgi:hypothetical protein
MMWVPPVQLCPVCTCACTLFCSDGDVQVCTCVCVCVPPAKHTGLLVP